MTVTNWHIEDDRKTVTITFPTTPLIALKWDTDVVSEHLGKLGEFRALMQPEVGTTWAPGQLFRAIIDPVWSTEPEVMEGNSVLHVRDPRFGWLHYVIPRHEARKLGEALIRQADQPVVTPPTKPS